MSPDSSRVEAAAELMEDFAERTGITSDWTPRRYLWTDAFAVCNFLALERATGETLHRERAHRTVEQVHRVLGRHRPDDSRRGWISGLEEAEGERHPTRGGLRIGKELPERPQGVPLDEGLEWDRDGQYFHYLTRWMHALDQMARTTRDPRYNLWARELAQVAHTAFTYQTHRGEFRMFWKMSIDLTRPLVPSMGQHDPLDGFVTCAMLRATAAALPGASDEPRLGAQLASFAGIALGLDWATTDPLDLGGLLLCAARIVQLESEAALSGELILDRILAATLAGLEHNARSPSLRQPPATRLAFRELGLAMGLARVDTIARFVDRLPMPAESLKRRAQALGSYVSLGSEIVSFWRDPAHRRAQPWEEHRDINEVMLATCLLPAGDAIGPAARPHRGLTPEAMT